MQRRDLVLPEPKRVGVLPAWLERLLSLGIVATDPDIVRRQRFVNVAAFRHGRQFIFASDLQRGL